MSVESIKKVAVIGAGTMGAGIAQLAAMHRHQTILFDVAEDALEKAKKAILKNLEIGIEKGKISQELLESTRSNLTYTTQFNDLKADFIIEAIVEKLTVKQEVFAKLEMQNSEKCILATNTSSIPITQIGAGLKRPGNLVGMHFFNPAHIMKLVEVISGAATDEQVAKLTYALAKSWGKKAVMAKDAPGFIVNRVARHFYVESLLIAEEGIAGVETIDQVIENTGFKMGPFRLMDLIGVDTNFSVTSAMYESFHFNSKFRPSRIQQQKVDAGHHGRKTGKGFYNY